VQKIHLITISLEKTSNEAQLTRGFIATQRSFDKKTSWVPKARHENDSPYLSEAINLLEFIRHSCSSGSKHSLQTIALDPYS
jgi:hypothetical protein